MIHAAHIRRTDTHLALIALAAFAASALAFGASRGPGATAAGAARPVAAAQAPRSSAPVAAVEHVLIVSVDGLRPDALLRANAPTLRGLMSRGAFSFWARTTDIAITLPSHTSMLTGVTPAKHGVTWNADEPLHLHAFPRVPTILELAHRAGLATEMAAGKSKFRTLEKPLMIDRAFVPEGMNTSVTDPVVADHALELYAQGAAPALTFVHFPDVDAAGHSHGWGSPEQIDAIGRVDAQIARLLAAIDRTRTIVIVSADHGGAGTNHGHDDPRSRYIPWIIVGPGVRANFDLTRIAPLEIRTEDTAATALWLLGLPLPAYLDGKVVREAFQTAPEKQ